MMGMHAEVEELKKHFPKIDTLLMVDATLYYSAIDAILRNTWSAIHADERMLGCFNKYDVSLSTMNSPKRFGKYLYIRFESKEAKLCFLLESDFLTWYDNFWGGNHYNYA